MSAFLNPSLLLGAALVAIPIVLHLIMRQKPRHLEFPALRFIQQREHVNRRRLRFRHVLLLALRAGAICLLAVALARPSVRSVGDVLGSREAPVAAALVFDTSLRTGYQQRNQTRLQAAQELGDWLVRQLPDDSDVAVLDTRRSGLVDDEAAPLVEAFSVDAGAALARIENLGPTPVADTLADTVGRALDLLARSNRSRRELYIFTDLTQPAWQSFSPQRLQEKLSAFTDLGIYILDTGATEPQNFALEGVELSSQRLFQGGELRVRSSVRRTGPADRRHVELWMTEQSDTAAGAPQKRGETVVEVADGEAAAVEFALGNLPVGTHQGSLRLVGGDGLAHDDERFFTVEVVPAWRVLLAGPPPAEDYTYFLREALAPRQLRQQARSRFRCEVAALDGLSQSLSAYSAVCLLDPTPPSPEAWRELTAYVAAGGGVAFFLGRNAQAEAFNTPAAQALLPARLQRPVGGEVFLTTQRSDHPMLKVFSQVAVPWDAFPIRRSWQVADELNEAADVLMRYSDGRPALLERRIGRGRVLMLTTPVSDRAAEPDSWNELTGFESWPFFVLANEMALHLVGSSEVRLNYLAGEPAVLPLDAQQRVEDYVLTTPGGARRGRHATRPLDRILESSTATAGNYRVESREANLNRGFSVNYPTTDSDLTRLDPEELKTLFGQRRYRLARSLGEFEREVGQARDGYELYPFLVLLLALVLALEHLVANRFYHTAAASPAAGVSAGP